MALSVPDFALLTESRSWARCVGWDWFSVRSKCASACCKVMIWSEAVVRNCTSDTKMVRTLDISHINEDVKIMLGPGPQAPFSLRQEPLLNLGHNF